MPHCSVMSKGTSFFISKLKFSYAKYSVDKVWTKIYCHFYFRGITLSELEHTSKSRGTSRSWKFVFWATVITFWHATTTIKLTSQRNIRSSWWLIQSLTWGRAGAWVQGSLLPKIRRFFIMYCSLKGDITKQIVCSTCKLITECLQYLFGNLSSSCHLYKGVELFYNCLKL